MECYRNVFRSNRAASPSNYCAVRPLMRFLGCLRNYTRLTSNLPENAIRVREALLRARDPAALLFGQLPEACGCEPFGRDRYVSDDDAERFVRILKGSLKELQS